MSLFKKLLSVDAILKPAHSLIAQLEEAVEGHRAEAERHALAITEAEAKKAIHEVEASRAGQIAAKFRNLLQTF